MKDDHKRLLSILLCLAMVLAMLPLTVSATSTTTLYCGAPDDWDACYAYWWGSSDSDPTWPGELMSQDENGIWYYDVPSDATNIIFHDGNGTQTGDLTMPTDENVQYSIEALAWGVYGATEFENTEPSTQVTEPTTGSSTGYTTHPCEDDDPPPLEDETVSSGPTSPNGVETNTTEPSVSDEIDPEFLASGTCGDSVSWKLDEDGTLTISGTGPMFDWQYWYGDGNEAPWYDYDDSIRQVVIEPGVTTIGDDAFYYCHYISSVSIPDTVTSIGTEAFRGMYYGLNDIIIPDSIVNIDDLAFYDCLVLDKIYFEGDAPTIGDNTFYNVTAKAYYPSGNDTWTEELMQDYGGTITWGASDQITTPTLDLQYPSLSFEGEVVYNIYYTAEGIDDVVDMGLLVFDGENTDGTIAEAKEVVRGFTTDGSLYMVHSNGIPAKEMGDALFFKVYAKVADGSYVYTELNSYDAVSYANTILDRDTSSDQMKSLVVALLNYGAEAQLYFGYKTDALMNAELTDDQKALVSDYDETLVEDPLAVDPDKVGMFTYNSGDFTKRYPTVSFDGAFSINYYFTPGYVPDNGMTLYYWDQYTYEPESTLTTENATGTIDMVPTGIQGQYWGQVTDIAAKRLDETIFVAAVYTSGGITYTTGVLSYSIGQYCKEIAAKDGTSQALVKAAAVYGHYAKAFFLT